MGVALGAGFVLALALSGGYLQPRRALAALLMLGVLWCLYFQFGISNNELSGLSLDRIEQMRRSLAEGSTAYHGDVKLGSPIQALLFLPIGGAYFLLGPFPWLIRNVQQFLTVPEMLVIYYYLLPAMRGSLTRFRRGSSSRRTHTLGLLIPTFVILVVYSLVSSNMGTAFRHRAQILAPLIILGVMGVQSYRSASRATPSGWASTSVLMGDRAQEER